MHSRAALIKLSLLRVSTLGAIPVRCVPRWKGAQYILDIKHADNEQLTLMESSVVQSLSRVRLFVIPWTTAHQASQSLTLSWSLLKLMSIELVMPSNHLILCCPLLLLPLIFPSIKVFSNESALHIRWPKYCSFSFSISPSSEYLGLISFRTDWFALHLVQGTLKTLLQHHRCPRPSNVLDLPYGLISSSACRIPAQTQESYVLTRQYCFLI